MSWFLGIWHENGIGDNPILKSSKCIHNFLELDHANSGDTVHISKDNNSGWIVCGNGINYADGICSLVKKEQWNTILTNKTIPLPGDGHYAALQWGSDSFSLFTDVIEYRRIYYYKHNYKIYFSTDLFRLVPFLHSKTYRMSSFSSQFLMISSYSDDSLLNCVERLGQKGEMHYKQGEISSTNTLWEPRKDTIAQTADEILEAFTTLPLREGKQITLGLSGGVDCRTLLAILLKENQESTSIYSLGVNRDPDFELAKEISNKLKLESRFFNLDSFYSREPEQFFEEMRWHGLHTEGAVRLDSFFHRKIFSAVGSNGSWMIDGGMGEYLRQSFGNKVLRRKRAEMVAKEANALYPIFQKQNCFRLSTSIFKEMEKYSIEELEKAISKMPETDKYIPESWFNIFTLRYRVRNVPPNAHGLVDACTLNHMPFAQPTLLSKIEQTPLRVRENSAIARSVIKRNFPKVSSVPYLRRGIRAPFWLMDHFYPMIGFSKIVKKINPPKLPEAFVFTAIGSMRELLLDRLTSKDVQECSWYSKRELNRLEKVLLNEDLVQNKGTTAILEWIQFDIWREHLNLA